MNKILVIEDDQLIQNNLLDLLTSEEYNVVCANNGREGINKIQNFYPDLIICDIMMPGLNGFEVLSELQKDDDTAGIPFLFLTAKTEMENLRHGMRLGADDYLVKPFDVDEILEVIKTRIKKNERNNERLKQMQHQIAHKIPHDLRTPLVPILGYAEMIESEDDIELIKSMIKTIKTSGKVLHNRIEKFLLYKDLLLNRISKSDNIRNEDITTITNELVSFFLYSVPDEFKSTGKIEIDLETADLKISELYLKNTLIELIENGLRYSEKDSLVKVNGFISNDNYTIIVSDNGKGMTQAQINSITAFKKFSEDSIPEPGLGLGLAIVENTISLHGGSFYIRSEVGKGTECVIDLPKV